MIQSVGKSDASPAIPIQSLEIVLPPLSQSTHTSHSMVTRSKSKNTLPNHQCLTAITVPSPFSEPATYQEAFHTPEWTQAMKDEFQAKQTQQTWSLVPLPQGKHAIGCKWVFKLKRNSDGSIARHKASLVAKGYLQKEGEDFQDTFSPVAKQPTVRILLCMALHFNWPLKQLVKCLSPWQT